MKTLLSPNYVFQETSRDDLAIAGMAWGFTLGFGFLTTWTALKQTIEIGSRYGIKRLNQPYIWMIWLEILVSLAYGILTWLYLRYKLSPSFAFYFCVLTFWALQVHFLLQIIINRIGIILPSPRVANRLKVIVAVFILCINISVYNIWIPARLQISERYIRINEIWDRCEKVLYLLVDAALNCYFIHTVQEKLVKQGLKKYERVVQFNKMIVGLSLSMDCLIIGMMSLENTFVYMQFHPLAYIVKLNIEMSMASLIVEVCQDSDNATLRKERLNGDIQYLLVKRRPRSPRYSNFGFPRMPRAAQRAKSSVISATDSFQDDFQLARIDSIDSQTRRKYMGRYEGEYQHDIRAYTKTEITVEEQDEKEVGNGASQAVGTLSASPTCSLAKADALEMSKRTGLREGLGVRTEIWAPGAGGMIIDF